MKDQTAMLIGGALLLGAVVVARRRRVYYHATPRETPFAAPRDAAQRNRPSFSEMVARMPTVRGSVALAVAPEPSRLGELLEMHVSGEALPNKFYQVREGDTPVTIARAVLASVGRFDEAHVLDYVYCFTSAPFNLDRYGTPSTSRRFPARWRIPGFGRGLRGAFVPHNADALAAMHGGKLPARTVDERTGKPLDPEARELGLVWLPPVDPGRLAEGIVTCSGFSWPDGSSTLNPDPELMALLEAA